MKQIIINCLFFLELLNSCFLRVLSINIDVDKTLKLFYFSTYILQNCIKFPAYQNYAAQGQSQFPPQYPPQYPPQNQQQPPW